MSYIKRTALTLGFIMFQLIVIVSIAALMMKSTLMPSFQFDYFDAVNYEIISSKGYSGYLVAFFPAFPLLWSVTGLSAIGISVLNILIFSLGYSLLSHSYQLNVKSHLFFLSIPSLVFISLPYSEALFFLFGTLVVISLRKENWLLFYLSLFLCSITRPIVYVFVPALILVFFLNTKITRERIKVFIKSTLSVLIGLFTTHLIQRIQTGQWFTFFEEQQKGWGNKLGIPSFPLSSWGGDFIVTVDGIALWFCLFIGIVYLHFSRKDGSSMEKIEIASKYSLAVITGTGLLVLFTRDGSLFSLNRFVFASPFFIVSLLALRKVNITPKHLLLIGSSFMIFSLMLGSYLHIKGILKYFLISAILTFSLIVFFSEKEWLKKLQTIPFVVLLICQYYFAYRIVSYQWIG